MNTLPRECQQLANAFAHGWQPTPSARAMRAFWQVYPWVPEMQQQLESPRNAVLLYRHAHSAGARCCHKCNSCYMQQLHDIRVKYEPELVTDELGRLWS